MVIVGYEKVSLRARKKWELDTSTVRNLWQAWNRGVASEILEGKERKSMQNCLENKAHAAWEDFRDLLQK